MTLTDSLAERPSNIRGIEFIRCTITEVFLKVGISSSNSVYVRWPNRVEGCVETVLFDEPSIIMASKLYVSTRRFRKSKIYG